MVAANDNTTEQPKEINPEVPSEENSAAADDDVEVELTKDQKLAAIPSLMAEGQRAYLTKDYEAASEKFSMATEYAVFAYEDVFAPECFEPHYQYGRALAALAELENEDPQVEFDSVRDYVSKMAEERAEKLKGATEQPNLDDSRVGNPDEITGKLVNTPFSLYIAEVLCAALGEERDEIVAAVDKALEENAEELDKLGEKSEETKEDIEANGGEESAAAEGEAKEETPEAETESKEDEAADATVETEADKADVDMDKTVDIGQNDTEMEEGGDEDGEEEEEEDPASALLAWEALEIARKICEKQGDSKEWELKKAMVLTVLGELSVTEDKYDNAIADLQSALEINQKHLDENHRDIASSYYSLAVAYRSNDDYLKASEFMKKAKDILTACYEALKAGGDNEEVKTLEEVLKEVSSAYEDCQSSYQDSERKKVLKEKEVKQISPEKPKENFEPAADITSNIRKGKRPAEVEPEEAKKAKIEEEAAPSAEIPADPVA